MHSRTKKILIIAATHSQNTSFSKKILHQGALTTYPEICEPKGIRLVVSNEAVSETGLIAVHHLVDLVKSERQKFFVEVGYQPSKIYVCADFNLGKSGHNLSPFPLIIQSLTDNNEPPTEFVATEDESDYAIQSRKTALIMVPTGTGNQSEHYHLPLRPVYNADGYLSIDAVNAKLQFALLLNRGKKLDVTQMLAELFKLKRDSTFVDRVETFTALPQFSQSDHSYGQELHSAPIIADPLGSPCTSHLLMNSPTNTSPQQSVEPSLATTEESSPPSTEKTNRYETITLEAFPQPHDTRLSWTENYQKSVNQMSLDALSSTPRALENPTGSLDSQCDDVTQTALQVVSNSSIDRVRRYRNHRPKISILVHDSTLFGHPASVPATYFDEMEKRRRSSLGSVQP
jgi:hypothetical protein